ncbi:MAG: hypothetical protein ABIQ59_13380 [Nocardioidaceae bacterium]
MTSVARTLARVDPRIPSAFVLLGIIVMAVHYAGPQLGGEGLDGEFNAPAIFSTAVLLWAAVNTAGLAASYAARSRPRVLFLAFAGILAYFGTDELLSFHEELESWTGVDWEVLYLPLVVAGAVTGLGVLLELRQHRPLQAVYVAGGLAWVVAQLLEVIQWDGDVLVLPATIYPEELLEVTGSAVFALAALIALRKRVVLRSAQDHRQMSHRR